MKCILLSLAKSKTGGTPGKTDAYDRDTTIGRIQQAVEAIVSEHVPRGQTSTVEIQVEKPGGALRRMMRGTPGVYTTTIQFRIGRGVIRRAPRVRRALGTPSVCLVFDVVEGARAEPRALRHAYVVIDGAPCAFGALSAHRRRV